MKQYHLEDAEGVGKMRMSLTAAELKLSEVKKGNTEYRKLIERKEKYMQGAKRNEQAG